jgi:hypothetical protein
MQINLTLVLKLTRQRWSRSTFSLSLALLVCRPNIHPSHYFPAYFLLATIQYIKYRINHFIFNKHIFKVVLQMQQKGVQSTMVGVRLRTLAMFTVPLTRLGCLIAPSSSCNQQPDHHQDATQPTNIWFSSPLDSGCFL